tara:strand:- start:274 stop:1134 length:861 start_codon:yes stop_codon:yes gene_type:complete
MNINTKKIKIDNPVRKSKKQYNNRSYNNRSYHSHTKNKGYDNPNRIYPTKDYKSLNNKSEIKKSKTKFEDVCLGQVVYKKSKKSISNNVTIKSPESDIKNEISNSNMHTKSISKKNSTNADITKINDISKKLTRIQFIDNKTQKNKIQDTNIKKKYNITKKEFPNKVTTHKQGVLDKYYSQKELTKKISTNKNVQKRTEIKRANVKNTLKPKIQCEIKSEQNTYKKVVLKTNISYYEKTNKYLYPGLLEKNIENIKYYNNIPDIEDRYLTSIITEGVNINKITFNE